MPSNQPNDGDEVELHLSRIQVIALLITGLLLAILAFEIFFVAPFPSDGGVHWNESADWCDEHNGDLEHSRALWGHGGLHCELPNGTSVHMSEVVTDG